MRREMRGIAASVGILWIATLPCEGDPEIVLEESIDLSEGSGAFVIDPNPTDWCGEIGD